MAYHMIINNAVASPLHTTEKCK